MHDSTTRGPEPREPQVARDGAGRWCAVVGEGRLDYGPTGPVRTLRRLPVDPTATRDEAEAVARVRKTELQTRGILIAPGWGDDWLESGTRGEL